MYVRNSEYCIMRHSALIEETTVADVRDQGREQRNEQRQQLDGSASLIVIGSPSQVLYGEVRNVSQGGTQIWLSQPVQPFTLVKIEYNDSLLLGEVVYCRQDQSGWLAGVRVEHGLFGLKALARVMCQF
jgi:hypothetical protein